MRRLVVRVATLVVAAGFLLFAAPRGAPGIARAQDSGPFIREIAGGGTASLAEAPAGSDAVQFPEFSPGLNGGEGADAAGAAAAPAPAPAQIVNRSQSKEMDGSGERADDAPKAKSNPTQVLTFQGLNHRQQRLANGGKQFSLEPPDQGLCAGNGFVLESINDALRVFDTAGTPLSGVIDLNTFYGYPAAIVRATQTTPAVFGPFVTDPSCLFDAATQRWFQVVLTLDQNSKTGDFTGKNHLDLAVSKTSSPLGGWNIYRIPVQDDGTDGTPDHHCPPEPKNTPPDATNPKGCVGDFPHIGADANAFFITTNEYPFFPDTGFHAAQVYAISKTALAAGAATFKLVQFDTVGAVAGAPGFTVWPATARQDDFEDDAGGTEYFLSSMAAEETGNATGADNRIALWAVSNTLSINAAAPALTIRNTIIPVGRYSIPPRSNQKPGNFPLGQCINDTTTVVFGLKGCWQAFFEKEPAHTEVEARLDSSDTRMMQVFFANGRVWGALDTAVNVGGKTKAGIEFFIVKPELEEGRLSGRIARQGYLAVANNNVTYPAIAVTRGGRAVMAFTLLGDDHFPSAAYAGLDELAGVGEIHIASEGIGPADGFSEYKAFSRNPRARWGDYGAAVVDGNSIWIASESIEQTCTLAQYVAAPFGSCGATRTSLANWSTRITKVTP